MRKTVTQQLLNKIIGIKAVPPTISSKIKIIGVENLKPMEGRVIQEMMNESLDKIEKEYLPKVNSYVCDIKLYDHAGPKRNHSIRLKLNASAMMFRANAEDYDINAAISSAIGKLEKEILRFKEKTRERQGCAKGKGRRKEFDDEELEFARNQKQEEFRAKR